ncbi:MAG: GNAT family N-acetyltransferase [candidate division Zixibacteria bacterium]|nr:GNAT family N-acetyltransferase [candidate division Zixibacteria bacterium]
MTKLKFSPASKSSWPQLLELFGERGACAGCWCMWWRVKRSEWRTGKGAGNRRALKKIVDSGVAPGILAFDGKRAIGWCSVGPRTEFPGLERSRTLKPIDDQPVWSIVCLFVDKDYRRRGVATALLDAAAKFAKKHGASIVEGYPVIPRKGEMPDVFAFTGLLSAFEQADYTVVKRPSASRAIVRRIL